MNLRTNKAALALKDNPEFSAIGAAFGFFVGMLTAATLDMNTPLPAYIWLSVWAFITLLPVLVYGFVMTHKANRINDSTVYRFLALSKDEKKVFPPRTKKALFNDTASGWYSVKDAVDGLLNDIEANKSAKDIGSADNLVESIKQTRQSLKIETDTFRELR